MTSLFTFGKLNKFENIVENRILKFCSFSFKNVAHLVSNRKKLIIYCIPY